MAKDTSKSRPRISGPEQTFATVLVGGTKTKFVLHEALLTYHSEFFRAALTGRFEEAETRSVTLANEDPETFELFVFWFYHEKFPSQDYSDDQALIDIWSDTDDEGAKTSCCLVELCVLADKLIVKQLKADTVSGLLRHIHEDPKNWLPASQDTSTALEYLPVTDPMCRLLVDLHCNYIDIERSDKYVLRDEHPVFLAEVVYRYMQITQHHRIQRVHREFGIKLDNYNYDDGEAEAEQDGR